MLAPLPALEVRSSEAADSLVRMASEAAALVPFDRPAHDFSTVDWSFEHAIPSKLDNLHPYPARFIQQIPAQLIECFPPTPGTAVFDPFCGAGTTLVAAAERGIRTVGVDLNPIAALISRVKTTPLTERLTPAAEEVVSVARCNPQDVPALPRLDHWFEPDVQLALAALIAAIDARGSSAETDALRLALSRIIVRVSNQDSDTRYAAVAKEVSGADVHRLFLKAAHVVDAALFETYGCAPSVVPESRVLQRDILEVNARDIGVDVGLVVTSPPYPNAYEYWLYHKYRAYWLGYDPVAVREREIGARPHYFRKNHQTEHDFERQMAQCFILLAQVVVPGGHACFVVGNSVIHGRLIDNASLLIRAAGTAGFELVTRTNRSVARRRKTFNLSHARINEESILVFRCAQ